MDRINTATAVPDLFGPGKSGFRDGNKSTGIVATDLNAAAFNGYQEELMSVVEGSGLAPNSADFTQLRQAITKMIQSSQRAVIIDSAVFAPPVTGTGKAVYWDQANSRFDLALADGTTKQNMVGFADVANSKLYVFGDAAIFTGLTPGSRYYLDGTTAGAITVTAPTNAVFVGIARSATEMFVDIDALPKSSSSSIQGAFKNLQASATGLSALIPITADEIIVESASNAYETLRAVNVSINSATVGANGLDTGVLAASTWYATFVIWNGVTKAGLISLSATAPTLPAGYTHVARTGSIYTDSTANKYPLGFTQKGNRVRYKVVAGSNLTDMRQMAAGATTGWAAIATGAFVPPTASEISLSIAGGISASDYTTVAPNSSYPAPSNTAGTGTAYPIYSSAGGAASSAHSGISDLMLESSNIYYGAVGANAKLFCLGYIDNL